MFKNKSLKVFLSFLFLCTTVYGHLQKEEAFLVARSIFSLFRLTISRNLQLATYRVALAQTFLDTSELDLQTLTSFTLLQDSDSILNC